MTTNEVGKKHLASAGLAAAARAASVYRHLPAGSGASGGHSPKRTQATTSLVTKSWSSIGNNFHQTDPNNREVGGHILPQKSALFCLKGALQINWVHWSRNFVTQSQVK